ncbi:MAG: sensor histidine kinase, partial [Pseudobdellovibrio sp.]
MKSIFRKIYNFKMIVSLVWLVFTFSIVAWWALIGLGIHTIRTPEEIERHQRMILWEGGALLLAILVGGFFLISYVYRDMDRHEKMKIFFANFSHDIKTSLSRLKLQAEVLTEQLSESPQVEKKSIDRFMLDLSRLELQLENSLLMSHMENSVLLEEQLMIKDLVESLSVEFESLKISLNKIAQIYADSRALRSILRNIFENSIRHGKATAMSIELKSLN